MAIANTVWDEILQQHVAIVGKTGSGKTYTAKGLVERLLREGKRVCVLDPTGAWWGLRTAADGVAPGHPVMIFGGDHGDVPISEKAGEAIGRLVAEQHVPAVIDLSETYLSERQRFVEHFAEAVYRLNKRPLHLVIDEADEFAPQNPPDTKRMLGAIDRIVRRGRIRGFRVLMISQRPAVIHKNVLTQANTLIAMRLTSPQDRKAIEDWIRGQADVAEGRTVLESLAKLQKGEGWVWAPELEILKRCKFPEISTYDSSRTPGDEEVASAPPATIAEVDVSSVREALEQAIAEAEANDPEQLRKRIKALEAEIRGMQRAPLAVPLDTEAIVAKAKAEAAAGYRPLLEAMHGRATELLGGMETLAAELHSAVTLLSGAQRVELGREQTTGESRATRQQRPGAALVGLDGSGRPPPAENGTPRATDGLSGPDEKILHALAWWQQVGVEEPTTAQLAFVAGYAPTGGTFSRYLSSLSSAGLIDRRSGRVSLTSEGCARTRNREPEPATLADLHECMRRVIRQSRDMGEPHVRILDVVLAAGSGAEYSTQELASRTGYAAEGGTFSRYLSSLSSIGLIVRRRGMVSASSLCFPASLGRH